MNNANNGLGMSAYDGFDQFGMAQPSSSTNFNLGGGGQANSYALQQHMMALQRQQQQQRSVSIASTDTAQNPQQNQQNQAVNPGMMGSMDPMTMFANSGISAHTSEGQASQIRQRLAQAFAQQAQAQAQTSQLQGGQGRSQTPQQSQPYWDPSSQQMTTQAQLGSGFPAGMDRQWIQQSMRAQNAQQAQLQALAQARAAGGTPGQQGMAGDGGGAMGPPQGMSGLGGMGGGLPWNAGQQQFAPQPAPQGSPHNSLQGFAQPLFPGQGSVPPPTGSQQGRMSVPPRPTSAASQASHYSAAPQQQQQQGSVQGTPTPSLGKIGLGSQGGMMPPQGGYGGGFNGMNNAGMNNAGMGNVGGIAGMNRQQQQQAQHAQMQQYLNQQQQNAQSQNTQQQLLAQQQRLYGLNANAQGSSSSPAPQQSPYATLGIPPPDGTQLHQSPSHNMNTTHQPSGPFAFNPAMGPPQQQMFQQQLHSSPSAGTPTLGKRKTPGGDVAGLEASVLSLPGDNGAPQAGKEGKPANQPRKKKEEKPPKEPKVTKAQMKQMERERERAQGAAQQGGQMGMQAGQTGMQAGQTGMQAGQTGMQAGQTGMQGGQSGPMGGSMPAQAGQGGGAPNPVTGNTNGAGNPMASAPPAPTDGQPPSNQAQMMALMQTLQQQRATFPFDPRLAYYVRTIMQNPQAYPALVARDPALEDHLKRALNMVKAGQVSPEMLGNMLKFMAAMSHIQQQQRAAQQQRQMQQQGAQPATPQAERVEQAGQTQAVPANVESERRPPSAHTANVPPPLDTSLPTTDGRPFTAGSAAAPPTPRPAVAPPPMEEWQRYLPTLPRLTSIAPLPRDIDERADPTFGGALPELTETQLEQYRTWLDRDIEYTRTLEAHSARMAQMTGEWLEKGVRPAWWQMDLRGERPPLVERMSILWPIEKAAARKTKRPQKGKVAKSMAEYYTKAEVNAVANVAERLIPIRLDMEIADDKDESRRYRDTFLWNAADPAGKLDKFVETICEDFQIRPDRYKDRIRSAIEEQIKQGEILTALASEEDQSGLSEEDLEWWKQQRMAMSESQESLDLVEEEVSDSDDDDDEERPETVDTLMAELQDQDVPEDLRIKIQLDIVSGSMHLSDTFEWELTSTVTPEEFAEVYAADLGLNGEFKTAIAHDIREQVSLYLKSLVMLGYAFDGSAVSDIDLKQEFLPAVTDVVRRDEHAVAQFTPFLVSVTETDMDRLETERERATTKKKRATRGRRGVVLPDREPIRTVRTRIGGELDDQGRHVARAAAPREPFVRPPAPSRKPATSRRAAALAARANITEMSTADHDDKFEAPPLPSPSRQKKSRMGTMTPAPAGDDASNGSSRVASRLAERLIPKEERMSVPLDPQPAKVDVDTNGSRPAIVRQTSWHCESCGRSESGVKGMRKMPGPSGPDTICSACADETGPATKEVQVKTQSRSRDESPAPFPDVASPESTSSSSADGLLAPSRPKPAQKRSSNNDRKLQTPLAQSTKPLPGLTPDGSKARSATGRVSQSPAQSTPTTRTLAPPIRPQNPRAASSQQPQPAWLVKLLSDLSKEKPREQVQAVYKGPPAEVTPDKQVSEADHWRIRCVDCQGKLYSLGPGETLQNFEKHLRNKTHLANVETRVAAVAANAVAAGARAT